MIAQAISQATSAQNVLKVLDEELDKSTFDEINLRAAFSRLGQLDYTFTRQLGQTATFSKLTSLLKSLLLAGSLEARSCANIFWAVARLRAKAPQLDALMLPFVEMIKFVANDFDGRQIANVVWACTAANLDAASLRELLAISTDVIIDKADSANARDIANIIWAGAKLRKKSQQLFAVMPAMVEVLEDLITDMNPQEASNIIWSAAVLRTECPELRQFVPGMAPRLIHVSSSLNEQQACNVVWAVGRLELDEPVNLALLGAVSARALGVMGKFTAQGMANFCWGMACCNWKNTTVLKAVVKGAEAAAPRWRKDQAMLALPMIMCSLARLGATSKRMLRTTANTTQATLPTMNPWGIAALLWSYRQLDIGNDFAGFRAELEAQVARRRISARAVERSYLGPEGWRAK